MLLMLFLVGMAVKAFAVREVVVEDGCNSTAMKMMAPRLDGEEGGGCRGVIICLGWRRCLLADDKQGSRKNNVPNNLFEGEEGE